MREAREEEEEIRASSSFNNTPIPSPDLVFHLHWVHMYTAASCSMPQAAVCQSTEVLCIIF